MVDFVIVPVFRVKELAAPGREAARFWGRHHIVPDDWHDSVIEDFARVCAIIGVELATRPVPLDRDGTRQKPCVYFSGFAS